MAKIKLEYIWLDGYTPEANMRSKTKIVEGEMDSYKLEDCPVWSFDGSSTLQAEGGSSDCLLKPVAICPDPARNNAFLVLAEVLNADETVHPTNHRGSFEDDAGLWFGFEQEYTLIDPESGRPLGFPKDGYPGPQGPYYCSVGAQNAVGREIVEEHLDICLEAGLNVEGINAEVMLGQWEFQVFAKGAKAACDELYFARYFLNRLSETYNVIIDYQPKPIKGDWNGSGMHCNFSTDDMRDPKIAGEEYMTKICEAFGKYHEEHIAVYGSDNDQRLTGLHETQSIDSFSYGVSDRGASIRVPILTAHNNWVGHLEDRRPASNACPYRIAGRIIETLSEV